MGFLVHAVTDGIKPTTSCLSAGHLQMDWFWFWTASVTFLHYLEEEHVSCLRDSLI